MSTKVKHQFVIAFKEKLNDLLYSGKSFYRVNQIDELEIRTSRIILLFVRTKKQDVSQCLYTSNSIVRYEIQRALCFYLAVVGRIPDVEDIYLMQENERKNVEFNAFTECWKDCKLAIRMPRESIVDIFGQYGKTKYIALTYFLKAQLVRFSNDGFRAAWTGFNTVMSAVAIAAEKSKGKYTGGRIAERDKLVDFATKVKHSSMAEMKARVETLSKEHFWKQLDWYNCFTNPYKKRHPEKLEQGSLSNLQEIGKRLYDGNIVSEKYEDVFLLKQIIKNYCGIKKNAEFSMKCTPILNEQDQVVLEDRIIFLICDYCYMLRNRNFHGEKAYPLFVISEEHETGAERALTELLLRTIVDLIGEPELLQGA